jgi:hypothetical protein
MNLFETPYEYLDYIKQILKNSSPIEGEPDPEFSRINAEQFKEMGFEGEYDSAKTADSDYLVESLIEYTYDSIEPHEAALVKKNIAFGKARNTTCNALAVKSSEGFYAILIHEGLM